MTKYNFSNNEPLSERARKSKEKRKKVLERVRRNRRVIAIEYEHQKQGKMTTIDTIECFPPRGSKIVGIDVYKGKEGEEIFEKKILVNDD